MYHCVCTAAGVIALDLARELLSHIVIVFDSEARLSVNILISDTFLPGDVCTAAGVIALDLARELLELHPNKIALVVSHENM
jgi:threonine dehydratase